MWLYLALLSAFFNALSNIAHRTHGSLTRPAELAWWSLLLSLPLGIGLLLTSNEPYWNSNDYVVPILASSLINSYGAILVFRAYRYGDASIVSPLTNLIPIALVITSFILLGVVPSLWGLLGILLVVGGVYYSSVSGKHDVLKPLKVMIHDRGSRSMLLWVVLMAFSTVFMSMALKSASAAFLMVVIQVLELFILSIYLLIRPQKHRLKHGERVLRKWGWHLAGIAVFATLSVFFQLKAMEAANISYVLSVKRLDVLFTIILAGLFLKEKHILTRFKGSAIALAGVIIILIAG